MFSIMKVAHKVPSMGLSKAFQLDSVCMCARARKRVGGWVGGWVRVHVGRKGSTKNRQNKSTFVHIVSVNPSNQTAARTNI